MVLVYLPTKLGHTNGVTGGIQIPAPWFAYGMDTSCIHIDPDGVFFSIVRWLINKKILTSLDWIMPLEMRLWLWYPLVMTNVAIEHGPVEIVDFASYKMLDLLIVM